MKVSFWGHAVLRVDAPSGAGLLTDPWFDEAGAFLGGWFQFPENSHLAESAFEGIRDIVVSHNHADHFDPKTLKRFLAQDEERRVHIARFATSWFADRARRFLGEFADRVVEHDPWISHRLESDLSFYFVPEESPGQIDSAIVFESQGRAFVNLNDARLDKKQFQRIAARCESVSGLALQASGASEYPVNYLYPDEDMRERCRAKRRLKFEACARVIDQLDPQRILFFAGPPVFLDPQLAELNEKSDHSVFPDQLDVLQHYEANLPAITERSWFAVPGDVLDDSVLWKTADLSDDRYASFTRRDEYVADYARRRQEYVIDAWASAAPADDAALFDHFETMARISPWMARNIDGALTFVIKGAGEQKTFTVDFRNGEVTKGEVEDALYVLTAPASSVNAILRGDATWDDVFLSMRMIFDEKSESFVAHFKTLLKYLDRDICAALEVYEDELASTGKEDTFLLEHEGRCYRVQRHCPHAGVDLEAHGELDDEGVLICTAHRFRFDLATGRCLNVRNYEIAVRVEDK